jgi:hypothetical protein
MSIYLSVEQLGWYDASSPESPAHKPDKEKIFCPVCGLSLTAEGKSRKITFRVTGGDLRSYFYYTHESCHRNLSREGKKQLDEAFVSLTKLLHWTPTPEKREEPAWQAAPPGPTPIPERDPAKRARIIAAIQFLETASDALYQDQQEYLRRGERWPAALHDAHAAIRRTIARRMGFLPDCGGPEGLPDPFAGDPERTPDA